MALASAILSYQSGLRPYRAIPERGRASSTEKTRKRSVLIVDDDATITSVLEFLLADSGYEVRSAGDGRVALQLSEEWHPDLILLDLMMPVMNGWEVMTRLRANPEMRHIPVLILSADQNVARKAMDLGAEGYIAKPFDVDDLLSRVASLLKSHKE
jgi:CheY-like chemotaxis protein